MTGYVYSLNCKKTKKPFYVGCTQYDVQYRMSEHQYMMKAGKTKLYNYIRKNGISFYIVELECLKYQKQSTLLAAEMKWIKKMTSDGHLLTNTVKVSENSKVWDSNGGVNVRISADAHKMLRDYCSANGYVIGGFLSKIVKDQIGLLKS